MECIGGGGRVLVVVVGYWWWRSRIEQIQNSTMFMAPSLMCEV